MRTRRTAGFTIIELLVVISIIGILVGMLMPAISNGLARARANRCRNNLRNLGFAVQNYLTTNRVIPISISPWSEGANPFPQRNGRGWIVGALGFAEGRNLQNQLESKGNFEDGDGIHSANAPNREALNTQVDILTCPDGSDSLSLSSTSAPGFSGIPVAMTSYKGCLGDSIIAGTTPGTNYFPDGSANCHDDNPCNGLFWRNSYQFAARWDRFGDGTSNTFLIGEDLPHHNINSVWSYANGDWATCSIPLNYKPDPPTPYDIRNVMSFRSNHVGGANFAFADGQVRFVHDTISLNVYRALATRDNRKLENIIPNMSELR